MEVMLEVYIHRLRNPFIWFKHKSRTCESIKIFTSQLSLFYKVVFWHHLVFKFSARHTILRFFEIVNSEPSLLSKDIEKAFFTTPSGSPETSHLECQIYLT